MFKTGKYEYILRWEEGGEGAPFFDVVVRSEDGVRTVESAGTLVHAVGESVGLVGALATCPLGARPSAMEAIIATSARVSAPTSQTCRG